MLHVARWNTRRKKSPKNRVPTSPEKSWKVLGFSPKISRPWKVLENGFGPGKCWILLVVKKIVPCIEQHV